MICNHAKAVVDIVNVMKKILIPIFVAAVCLLGFVVFQDTETKKQQQLNQLMNSAEPKVQNPAHLLLYLYGGLGAYGNRIRHLHRPIR